MPNKSYGYKCVENKPDPDPQEEPDPDTDLHLNDQDPQNTGVTDLRNSCGIKVPRHLRAGRRAETVRQLQK
jgi:hypothetical protein